MFVQDVINTNIYVGPSLLPYPHSFPMCHLVSSDSIPYPPISFLETWSTRPFILMPSLLASSRTSSGDFDSVYYVCMYVPGTPGLREPLFLGKREKRKKAKMNQGHRILSISGMDGWMDPSFSSSKHLESLTRHLGLGIGNWDRDYLGFRFFFIKIFYCCLNL